VPDRILLASVGKRKISAILTTGNKQRGYVHHIHYLQIIIRNIPLSNTEVNQFASKELLFTEESARGKMTAFWDNESCIFVKVDDVS
jgi:hypothetical protein